MTLNSFIVDIAMHHGRGITLNLLMLLYTMGEE